MSAFPQPLLASQQAAIQHMLAVQSTLFSGIEKLVDLNLQVAKASIEDFAAKSQQVAQAKDAQEAFAASASLVQPGAEKSMAYGKSVYDLLLSLQVDLTKLSEAQLARLQQQIAETLEQFPHNVTGNKA